MGEFLGYNAHNLSHVPMKRVFEVIIISFDGFWKAITLSFLLSQTVFIELVMPQAAQLNIYF